MTIKHYGVDELEKEYGLLSFGRLLQSHRLGEGFSQVDMAKFLGMSKQSLNDLESGRRLPSIGRAIEIGRKCGLMEALVVQLILQAQINQEKLKLRVQIVPEIVARARVPLRFART